MDRSSAGARVDDPEWCRKLCGRAGDMGRFRDVQAFVREAGSVESLDALHVLMEATVGMLGFEFYALGHHVNTVTKDLVQIGNYPQIWGETLRARNYISDDPVLLACQTSAAGFLWSDVPNLISLTAKHREILDGAMRAGLGDGFTTPVHIPGECAGSCSFGKRLGRSLNEANLPIAQYVGCFAFEAARRLVRSPPLAGRLRDRTTAPALTTRQLDCVVLVARGKSDWDAAKLLGISEQTVHQHVEMAKQKYGVATRTQLVVRALFDNQLGFQDIIRR